MTNEQYGAADQDQEHAEPAKIRERTTTRDRLVSRTCGWCGVEIPYSGVGRPPKFCQPSHRRLANLPKRARARAERTATAAGERTAEPVREVIERTKTTTRIVVRQSPPRIVEVPVQRPAPAEPVLGRTPQDWYRTLQFLAADARHGMHGSLTRDSRDALVEALESAARTLRAAPVQEEQERSASTGRPELPHWLRRQSAKGGRKKTRR